MVAPRDGPSLPLLLAAAFRVLGFLTEPLLDDRDIHRVVGEPARLAGPGPIDAPAADAPSDRVTHLSIVTWNIERGMAYDAILRTLRALDADIVLLQEVDRHCRRTGYRDIARELAEALAMNWVAAGEFTAGPAWARLAAQLSTCATRATMPYGILAFALVGQLPVVLVLGVIGAHVYWISLAVELRRLLPAGAAGRICQPIGQTR